MSDYVYKSGDSTIVELTKPSKDNLYDSINYFTLHVEPNVLGWFYQLDHVIIHQIMVNLQSDTVGDICEIGVAFGKSTVALSSYRKSGEKLYLFDVFAEHEKAIAASNIIKYGNYIDCEWHIGDTALLTPDSLPFNNKIRILHIDGCHEHTAVWKDLTNFSEVMTDNGVIILDDYSDPEYPGVNSGAIQFLIENTDWCIFAIGQNKSYLCRKNYQAEYAERLLELLSFIRKEHHAEYRFNLRQVLDTNVLLTCSREDTEVDQIKTDLHNEMNLR